MRRLAALALLAGCGLPADIVGSTDPTVPASVSDTCRATPYLGLIGQQDTALERVLILRAVRVLRPGMARNDDLNPERINFVIGPDGRIADIRCG